MAVNATAWVYVINCSVSCNASLNIDRREVCDTLSLTNDACDTQASFTDKNTYFRLCVLSVMSLSWLLLLLMMMILNCAVL